MQLTGGLPSGRGSCHLQPLRRHAPATGLHEHAHSRNVVLRVRKVTSDEEVVTEVIPQSGWLWDSKATATRAKLASVGAKPKKALGQNFVTDDNILARIVRESNIQRGDYVLEIGPGTGNLTKHILEVSRGPSHSFQ